MRSSAVGAGASFEPAITSSCSISTCRGGVRWVRQPLEGTAERMGIVLKDHDDDEIVSRANSDEILATRRHFVKKRDLLHSSTRCDPYSPLTGPSAD